MMLPVWTALCLFLTYFGPGTANDFSSFLSANASLAVVIDQSYMQSHGVNIMAHFQKILTDIIREQLKNGGINVKYFTWSSVRLKRDFLAAITIADCENTWNFYKSTQQNNILLMAITEAECPRLPLERALMIPIVDHGNEFPQLILDAKVQQILKWNTVIVLVDQTILDNNPYLIKSFVYESILNNISPISLILVTIDDKLRGQKKRARLREGLQQFAAKYSERKRQQFMVMSIFYKDIIEIAENLNMFHINNQWLFLVLDIGAHRNFDAVAVTENLNEGANIAFALNETMLDCLNTLNCTISEVSMAFVTSISRMIYEEQLIYGEISDEEWEAIRSTKLEKQMELLDYIKEHLKGNSKCASCAKWHVRTAITWGKTQEHKKYDIAPPHNVRHKSFEFIEVGSWTPLLGFDCHELTFPHIEHHFRNITMDVVTMHNPPWQIISKDSKGTVVKHNGIAMEILKELSRSLNFTYYLHTLQMVEGDKLNPLTQNVNKSDNLLGSMTFSIPYKTVELMQGPKFFMAAMAATVDEPQKKPFNYTIPISVQKYSFISRQPDEISRIYLFTAPFTLETWACLVAVLMVTAPLLYAVNRLTPIEEMRIRGLCTIKNCFWYIYGALLQQGGMYMPKTDSGRLVIGFWWIIVIVLVTTYCGNLVAFLTFPKFQPGIDYLDELFTHTEIGKYGLRNGTLFERYTMSTTRSDFKRFMDRAVIYNNTQTEDIEAVKRGERINIDWRINLQLIVQRHFEKDKECRFALGKENFIDEQIALIVPTNSPYLQLINEQINRMFRTGFIERWHQKNLPSMDKCNGKNTLRPIANHKVNLDDMQGCFLVLVFGFMIALLVIFIEFSYNHFDVIDKTQRTFAN